MKWLAGLVSRVGLGSGYKWLVCMAGLVLVYTIITVSSIIMKKYVPVAAAAVVV